MGKFGSTLITYITVFLVIYLEERLFAVNEEVTLLY